VSETVRGKKKKCVPLQSGCRSAGSGSAEESAALAKKALFVGVASPAWGTAKVRRVLPAAGAGFARAAGCSHRREPV